MISTGGQRLLVADTARVLAPDVFVDLDVELARTLDDATRRGEDDLLVGVGRAPAGSLRLDLAEVEFEDPLDSNVERIADLYPGVVMGETRLLGQGQRSVTVRAATDVACFQLTREELMRLRSSDHLVYTRIIEHLLVSTAERLQRANRETSLLRDRPSRSFPAAAITAPATTTV